MRRAGEGNTEKNIDGRGEFILNSQNVTLGYWTPLERNFWEFGAFPLLLYIKL